MDVFFILLLVVIFFSIKFYKRGFNVNFLDYSQTLCVNGIFVILVFLRHSTDYCNFSQSSSNLFNFVNYGLLQLIVTTFLFYSGYGIYESIKNKDDYINKNLLKRIKKLYFNFLISVISFLIMNMLLGIKYNIKTILLSLFAWESIGNSNWYIFAIISMYFFTYICFKIFKKNLHAILGVTFLINLYTIILSLFKYSYWYDTVICFSLGLFVSYYKERIFNFFTKNNFIYLTSLIITVLYFYTFYKLHSLNTIFHELWALSFTILIMLVSLKLKVYSKTLLFLGKYTFWIYILQRMPMIILDRFNLNGFNNYLFVTFSFIITIIMAIIYKNIFDKFSVFIKKNKMS